ncbi:MAG: efflux RND transporter periplasmic adaptor subunit [Sedimentisphaerales bacterium]|nr:efflux RND transporter periplasmic adaptor subunit [Sedimentisphaerales bacterium]
MGEVSPQNTGVEQKRGRLLGLVIKAVIVLIAIGLLAGVIMMPADKEEPAATEAPPVNVTVETVAVEPQLVDSFDLPAVVEPNRVVTISAEVAGRIERILSTEGRPVAAGALLLELNADMIRPQVERVQAQHERNQIEYKRMAELVDMEATSRSDLDNATANLAASKAQLAEVKAQLERTRILVPMAGVLNDLHVEVGEYVQPGMPVAELVETDPVKVVVDVPERDVAFFEVGRQAEVFADVRGDEISRMGTITFINELADPQTRSTKMEVSVANDEGLLRSGQIVRVRLTRRILENAILIPLLAVIPMEQGQAVYVVNSSEAQRREVQLDIIQGDRIRVKEGLKPGDKLIVAGHRFVAPGQTVTVVSEKK